MVSPISRIDPRLIAQILGPGEEVPVAETTQQAPATAPLTTSNNTFDSIFNKAVDSLEGVSKLEQNSDVLMNQYMQGKAELSDVMIATAKMNLAVQLAVTTLTSAVNTFKEITQMQI